MTTVSNSGNILRVRINKLILNALIFSLCWTLAHTMHVMPIKKSAIKALRQSDKRAVRNRNVKESLAYLRRMLRKAIDAKELSKAEELAKKVVKSVDKAVQNKVIKKNTGSRTKSRIMVSLNKLARELKK